MRCYFIDIIDLEKKVKSISRFLSKESINDDEYDNIKEAVSEIITPTLIKYLEIVRLYMFRVRKINDISDIDSYSYEDILYPPAEVTEMGRGNIKNDPVFYGALDPVTAVNETEIKVGDYFLLGTFELLDNEINFEKERTAIIKIPEFNEKDDLMYRIANGLSSNFLYSEFTREITEWNKNRYYVTNAIVDHLFNKMNFRSLLYPSVMNNKRMNIMLNREAFHERGAFYYMYVCKMLKLSDDKFEAHIYKSLDQVQKKGELTWRTLDNRRVFTYESECSADQVDILKSYVSKDSE